MKRIVLTERDKQIIDFLSEYISIITLNLNLYNFNKIKE